MAFSRAAFRSCVRNARPTVSRPQLFRQVVRRGYASGGHSSAKAGGDTIWAVGAVGVTVPTCWYLLSNAPDTSHGHDDHGDAHSKSHVKEHDEEPKDEEGEKSEDAGDKGEESEKSEDSETEDEKKDADTPSTSDDEGEDDSGNAKNTIKTSESNQGIKAGEASSEAATSKPAGSKNSQSGKQAGLSNTDTKHSTDIANDPSKGGKGEGVPGTAKAKGTVNPK